MTYRRRAHACTAAALIALAAGLLAVPFGPIPTLPGLAAALLLARAGVGYRRQHRALRERCEQARRAAVVIPDPQPMPDWERLDEQARYDAVFDEIARHYDHGTAA
ncbi:hypothetical protein ACWD25_04105 [Streptomyces sp. NPDC002920]